MENIEELKQRLGRVYMPDERDKNFLIKDILPKRSTSTERGYKYWWPNGWWGDQGDTPQCVAYAWIHWLEDGGVTQHNELLPEINPGILYKEAQKRDIWAGENYDGTSVRGGVKALQERGYVATYRWTWDVRELARAILTLGPVVVGTDWYIGMFRPDKDGIVRLEGSNAGGHAYEVNGYNAKTGYFRCKNSWGRKWGKNGYFYMHITDMQTLLNNHGEACIATEIKKVS